MYMKEYKPCKNRPTIKANMLHYCLMRSWYTLSFIGCNSYNDVVGKIDISPH